MIEPLLLIGMTAMYFNTGTVDPRFVDASYREMKIDVLAGQADKKYVPDELRAPVGELLVVITAIRDQKLVYTWRF